MVLSNPMITVLLTVPIRALNVGYKYKLQLVN